MGRRGRGHRVARSGPLIEDKTFEQFVINATDQMSKDGVTGTPGVFIDGKFQDSPSDAVNAVLQAVQ